MNILVTGSGNGIGFETVKVLCKNAGNEVYAISRNISRLTNWVNHENVTNLHPLSIDLTRPESFPIITSWLQNIKVDILINNAGVLLNKPFSENTYQDFLYIYGTNFLGPLFLIQQLLPHFAKGAHILNIGSMGGFQGSVKFPGLSLYSSSKASLANLTECLAAEYAGTLVFNCLALGATDTDMLRTAFPDYKAPVSAMSMAEYIADFAIKGACIYNGKVLPVSTSTP